MRYHTFFKFITLLHRAHVKVDVCPGDDLQTFYPSESVRRSKLIQTNLTEPEPDVDLFIHLTH